MTTVIFEWGQATGNDPMEIRDWLVEKCGRGTLDWSGPGWWVLLKHPDDMVEDKPGSNWGHAVFDDEQIATLFILRWT